MTSGKFRLKQKNGMKFSVKFPGLWTY